MKKFYYGLVTIMVILTMYSCKGKLIDEFYLSSEMKAQIPFQGYENITFKDANENFYVLSGGDKYNDIYEYPECNSCKDYSIFERVRIKFGNNISWLYLAIDSGSKNNFSIGFEINDLGFGCSLLSPLSQETLRDHEIFYDSLMVNNKTYYHIFSDTLTHVGKIETDPFPVRCYYSTEYGVVKIDFSDSTSWELDHIEW